VYKNIPQRIVVEEFISDGTGPVPTNYRLHVFGGSVELIVADVGRGRGEDRKFGHYSRSWEKLNVPCRFKDVEVVRPKRLDDMVRYAEVLGEGLDFVRIDMYHAQDKVYFGEATTTPMGGVLPAYPHELNLYLGRLWKLSLR
jgi:TupA-like ATPgrasp